MGHKNKASIEQSSGHRVLDEEAMNTVKKASPFPKPPKELESRIFNVSVPINFSLKNNDGGEGILDWLF